MRIFLLSILIFISNILQSAVYYVSPNGNDNNSGTSTSAAWRTIDKVNSRRYTFLPGDQILFERGGVYRGSLSFGSSGNSTSPITISAYGSGNNPLFMGSDRSTSWTIHSGSIWKMSISTPVLYMFQDNELMELARYPNTGWLRNDNGSSTQINDAQLTQGSGYWAGARLVVRSSAWSYHIATISSYTPGTLNFPSIGGYNLSNRQWGYFLCNKLSELDSPGEWFWDSTSGMLYVWPRNGANPNTSNVEYSTRSYGIRIETSTPVRSYVVISNIDTRNYIDRAIIVAGDNHIVDNCKMSHSKQASTIYGNNNTIKNSFIEDIYATGIFITQGNNNIIESNQILRCGVIPGLGESGWGYFGIRISGNNNNVRKNRIDKVGYIAISFGGSTTVEKNFIDNSCYILSDGAAISFDNVDGSVVRDNIILDVFGNVESCAPNYSGCDPKGNGIYFGNTVLKNTIIDNNTIAYCNGTGIWVDHTMVSTGNQITNNSMFGNTLYQLGFSDYSNYNGGTSPYAVPVYNDIVTGNICYSLHSSVPPMFHINRWHPSVDFGTFNNNKYYNFWNQNPVRIERFLPTYLLSNFTLSQWQTIRGDDPNSSVGPYNPSSPQGDHILIYNDQLSTQNLPIPSGVWSDVFGNSYSGSVSVDSFRSKILYKTANSVPFLTSKVYLDGPMNWTTMKMNKSLNVPTTNPYVALGVPNSSSSMTVPQDSVVDWVLLQLVNTQNQILESKSFLVKISGEIISPSGSNHIEFTTDLVGKKLIIKHRNHLGTMTSNVLSNGDFVDFTSSSTSLYGTNPTKINNGYRALWSGDVNFDGFVKYTGQENDRDPILAAIGGNTPTNTVSGYLQEDVNMNGSAKYSGSVNDRDPILVVIGGIIVTNVRAAQLP